MMYFQGVANIASVSLAIGYPTVASVPHSIANGFKNLLAIAAVTDISFKEAEQVSNAESVAESNIKGLGGGVADILVLFYTAVMKTSLAECWSPLALEPGMVEPTRVEISRGNIPCRNGSLSSVIGEAVCMVHASQIGHPLLLLMQV